jgi:hypothetical protein
MLLVRDHVLQARQGEAHGEKSLAMRLMKKSNQGPCGS